MINIFHRRPGPIGLDIGHSAVRAVQLARNGPGWELVCAQERRYPQLNVHEEDGNTMIQTALKKVFQYGQFEGRDVILHCPVDHLDIRPMSIPCGKGGLDRETTMNAIRCEMADHLDFSFEHAVFDYQITEINPQGDGQSMVVFSADGEWIAKRIKMVEACGCHCRDVDALPCVLDRLAQDLDTQEVGDDRLDVPIPDTDHSSTQVALNVIIDMAADSSTLVVGDKNGPFLARRFKFGGNKLDELLSEVLMLELREGEVIKQYYGLQKEAAQYQSSKDGELTALLQQMRDVTGRGVDIGLIPELQIFVEGIIRTLNYVITDRPNTTLNRIYLAGALSQMAGLDKWLCHELDMPVVQLTTRTQQVISQAIGGQRGGAGRWATATGLAMTAK